jgi:cytochrome oxidase Cu insertion factor (SCO1/SenC/PrrC family)
MIDKNGNFIGTISFGEATEVAIEKVQRLVGLT